MLKRIITAIVSIMIFIPICVFSNTIIFPIAISALCAIGVYEIAKCLNQNKNLALLIPMMIFAVIIPMTRFFIPRQAWFFSFALICLFAILIYFLAYVMFRKNKDKLSDIMTLYAFYVYVIGCFSAILCTRYMSSNGKYYYLLIFVGAWVCDTFAYFTGRFLGKHKLIPEISPKKTIEGAIGGIVFDIGAFALYGFIVNKIADRTVFESYIVLMVLGLFAAVISQIGDLVASSIKRQYDIKDFGSIFPGHGGVLDRFDSVMLVAPVTYIFFYITNVIF